VVLQDFWVMFCYVFSNLNFCVLMFSAGDRKIEPSATSAWQSSVFQSVPSVVSIEHVSLSLQMNILYTTVLRLRKDVLKLTYTGFWEIMLNIYGSETVMPYHYSSCSSSCSLFFILLGAALLKKIIRLHHFKLDRALFFNTSIAWAGFLIWWHPLKMVAMTSFHAEKCSHLVSAHTVADAAAYSAR